MHTFVVCPGGESALAIGNAGLVAPVAKEASTTKQLKTFLSRYFYFCMSLVMAGLVVWGFSRTVDANLFHAKPPRPLLLWMHGAAFSTWVVFFIASVGAGTRAEGERASLSRLVWSGARSGDGCAGLHRRGGHGPLRYGCAPPEGRRCFPVDSIRRHDHLSAPASRWRFIGERSRNTIGGFVFIASCELMDAAIGRFDFWFNHSLFYVALDFLIVLGMMRDWVVDGRIHKVYLYALPR